MLKPKDLATVVNKLQAPLVVSDILRGEGALTGDVRYGLHEVISEMQPDSALLCIALSAKKIAATHEKVSATMGVLEMECARIIDDYAELWLLNAENENVDEAEAMEAISRIVEDLEGIAELLEINLSSLKDKNAKGLCEILSIQARAHALVAEAYFEAMEGAEAAAVVPAPVIAGNANNIVAFPGQKRT